jgi:hypothetical protein
MSAALQFPTIARAAASQRHWQTIGRFDAHPQTSGPDSRTPETGFGPARQLADASPDSKAQGNLQSISRTAPSASVAFYRKHTEKLLRLYLYASMLVSRSPSVFHEPVWRGRSSNQPVHTFEDCVIFVLDVEKGLAQISALDRLLLNRLVLQEYSLAETALLLNKSQRVIGLRLADALDRLTGILIDNGTLKIPNRCIPEPEEECED